MLNSLLQMHLKRLHLGIQKTAEVAGDLIGNKIAEKNTNVSKASSKNNLETNEGEILRERFIAPELRQKIIDNLRLV